MRGGIRKDCMRRFRAILIFNHSVYRLTDTLSLNVTYPKVSAFLVFCHCDTISFPRQAKRNRPSAMMFAS
jgi:hypothetical protein